MNTFPPTLISCALGPLEITRRAFLPHCSRAPIPFTHLFSPFSVREVLPRNNVSLHRSGCCFRPPRLPTISGVASCLFQGSSLGCLSAGGRRLYHDSIQLILSQFARNRRWLFLRGRVQAPYKLVSARFFRAVRTLVSQKDGTGPKMLFSIIPKLPVVSHLFRNARETFPSPSETGGIRPRYISSAFAMGKLSYPISMHSRQRKYPGINNLHVPRRYT